MTYYTRRECVVKGNFCPLTWLKRTKGVARKLIIYFLCVSLSKDLQDLAHNKKKKIQFSSGFQSTHSSLSCFSVPWPNSSQVLSFFLRTLFFKYCNQARKSILSGCFSSSPDLFQFIVFPATILVLVLFCLFTLFLLLLLNTNNPFHQFKVLKFLVFPATSLWLLFYFVCFIA